jgi:hypothetical protein
MVKMFLSMFCILGHIVLGRKFLGHNFLGRDVR